MSMTARYNTTTGALVAWSTVPFTIPAAPDEADREYPDETTLPGPGRLVVVESTTGAFGLDQVRRTSEGWAALRLRRASLLTQSDWTQLADAPLALLQKQAWVDYRQRLRDLPQTTADPFAVIWPTPPSP